MGVSKRAGSRAAACKGAAEATTLSVLALRFSSPLDPACPDLQKQGRSLYTVFRVAGGAALCPRADPCVSRVMCLVRISWIPSSTRGGYPKLRGGLFDVRAEGRAHSRADKGRVHMSHQPADPEVGVMLRHGNRPAHREWCAVVVGISVSLSNRSRLCYGLSVSSICLPRVWVGVKTGIRSWPRMDTRTSGPTSCGGSRIRRHHPR